MKSKYKRKPYLFNDPKDIKIKQKDKYLSLFPIVCVALNEFDRGTTFTRVIRKNSEYFCGEMVFEYYRVLGWGSASALQH